MLKLETPFRPVLLSPVEIRRVAAASRIRRSGRFSLTVTLTGLRCSELRGLRWRDVNMPDATLRVVDSKSEEGRRLIAIPQALVDELERHYQRTVFKGDDERVFTTRACGKWWVDQQGRAFREALAAASIDKRPPRHDARHGALTAMARNGSANVVLQHVAGHSSMQITRKYIHLARTVFPHDAELLAARQPSTGLSTDLTEPQVTSADLNGSSKR
jgi:integrase/recombinase XerD